MDDFRFCPSCAAGLELADVEELDGEICYVFDCPSCDKRFRYELPNAEASGRTDRVSCE